MYSVRPSSPPSMQAKQPRSSSTVSRSRRPPPRARSADRDGGVPDRALGIDADAVRRLAVAGRHDPPVGQADPRASMVPAGEPVGVRLGHDQRRLVDDRHAVGEPHVVGARLQRPAPGRPDRARRARSAASASTRACPPTARRRRHDLVERHPGARRTAASARRHADPTWRDRRPAPVDRERQPLDAGHLAAHCRSTWTPGEDLPASSPSCPVGPHLDPVAADLRHGAAADPDELLHSSDAVPAARAADLPTTAPSDDAGRAAVRRDFGGLEPAVSGTGGARSRLPARRPRPTSPVGFVHVHLARPRPRAPRSRVGTALDQGGLMRAAMAEPGRQRLSRSACLPRRAVERPVLRRARLHQVAWRRTSGGCASQGARPGSTSTAPGA